MIELYTAATPNGQKIHIMLEEVGLPYQMVWVNLRKGDQLKPEFLKISPTTKFRPSSTTMVRMESLFRCSSPAVNGGAKLVHRGGAKLVHLTLCGTRCWGVVPVVHRRDPRCFE